MRYGHFDDAQCEYVITRPDTPLPWVNYLGTDGYFARISNTAGGYSFYRNMRLTYDRNNNIPVDAGGRYIYLRDNGNGTFWSPTWQPVMGDLDNYSCRHGLGYTIIASEKKEIAARIRYFVPLKQTLEVWDVHLENLRETTAELSLFSAVEFCLWDGQENATPIRDSMDIAEIETEGSTIYHKSGYRDRYNYFTFLHCSEAVDGFDTLRDSFLGPYRGWHNPRAVAEGESCNSQAHSGQPIGSHHLKLTLAPGETRRVIFILGYHENPPEKKFSQPGSGLIDKTTVYPVIQKWSDPAAVDAAFTELIWYWSARLGKTYVNTPDPHVNRMVNIWDAYQCMTTFNLSCFTSRLGSGIECGPGWQASNQELLGVIHMVPDRVRQQILVLAARQFDSGGVSSQYRPLNGSNHGIGSDLNDSPLWLVLSVSAYLRETGDLSILNEPAPYENRSGSEQPLLDHLRRAIRSILDRIGPHGLPKIGQADLNPESVLLGAQFVLAANEMADLAVWVENPDEAEAYRQEALRMAAVLESAGWDGAWFRRAYDAAGNPVGSQRSAEGRIFLEPQALCVMASVACAGLERGKAQAALESLNLHCSGQHGIASLWPAYRQYDATLSGISASPPGFHENGSIFCHSNPWAMIAESILGNGGRALDYYLRICPSAREEISDVHRCEPYVYARTIAGPESPTSGEGKVSWQTGTAAMNHVAITQYILGVCPEWNGLRVQPVVPPDWQEFYFERAFRGVRYLINVKRVGPGNTCRLTVDGEPVAGTLIPLPDQKTEFVEVMAEIS